MGSIDVEDGAVGEAGHGELVPEDLPLADEGDVVAFVGEFGVGGREGGFEVGDTE